MAHLYKNFQSFPSSPHVHFCHKPLITLWGDPATNVSRMLTSHNLEKTRSSTWWRACESQIFIREHRRLLWLPSNASAGLWREDLSRITPCLPCREQAPVISGNVGGSLRIGALPLSSSVILHLFTVNYLQNLCFFWDGELRRENGSFFLTYKC